MHPFRLLRRLSTFIVLIVLLIAGAIGWFFVPRIQTEYNKAKATVTSAIHFGSNTKDASPVPKASAKAGVKGVDIKTIPMPALRTDRPVTHGDSTRPMVAITFDSNMTQGMLAKLKTDSTLSYNNTAVLDALEQSKTSATFFLSGLWALEYPKASARIAANPNFDLASHSYLHGSFTSSCYGLPVLSAANMASDITHSEQILAALHPVHMTNFFRFPGGCYDKAAMNAAKAARVQVVQWSVVAGDPFQNNPDVIARNVLTKTRNGAIIIMHITKANSPQTAVALKRILPTLCRKFQCVRLSELLKYGNVGYAGPSGP